VDQPPPAEAVRQALADLTWRISELQADGEDIGPGAIVSFSASRADKDTAALVFGYGFLTTKLLVRLADARGVPPDRVLQELGEWAALLGS
jgi:hypothetical protein